MLHLDHTPGEVEEAANGGSDKATKKKQDFNFVGTNEDGVHAEKARKCGSHNIYNCVLAQSVLVFCSGSELD